MNKTELTLGLIRYRFVQTGIRLGMSAGEAALMAEQRMRNEGLFGFFGKRKAIGTPEGAIVAIVEAALRSMVRQLIAEPAVARLDKSSPAYADAVARHNLNALQAIENHRAAAYGGVADYPKNLRGYVAYRIELEVRKMHGIDAAAMGLGPDTIDHMVTMAADHFRARLDDFR